MNQLRLWLAIAIVDVAELSMLPLLHASTLNTRIMAAVARGSRRLALRVLPEDLRELLR